MRCPHTAAALLAALSLAPQTALAQRAPRVTPQAAATLRGWNRVQAYNALYGGGNALNPTQTPEWRQGGNTWEGYLAVVQQKQSKQQYQAMVKLQQQMAKQQAAIDRWLADQAAKKSRGEALDPRYEQLLKEQAAFEAQLGAQERSRAEAADRKRARKAARNAALAEKAKAAGTGDRKAETLVATARALESKSPAMAARNYRAVLKDFPGTGWAATARARLDALEAATEGKGSGNAAATTGKEPPR